MHELIDFRLFEEYAAKFLLPSVGKKLGLVTRQLVVSAGSDLYAKVDHADKEIKESGKGGVFGGWNITRKYTSKELAAAELFKLQITAYFEPEGTACGTDYDESAVCPHCGAGRRLLGDLILDLGKVPKGKDFAQTIANDEWIVSERLAMLMQTHGMTGATFEQVCSLKKRREGSPIWYRLNVIAAPVDVAPPTCFGIDPFDDDPSGRYRCPAGHVAGLNILSELSIGRGSWDGADIAITRQAVGDRQGALMPSHLIVVSPRLRQLLIEHDIKGFKTEVAYLA